MKKIILGITLLLLTNISLAEELMNQELMEAIVKGLATESKGEQGVVEFLYGDVQMYLVSDVNNDRMRIIAPIVEYNKLSLEHVDAMLESNFHQSLDARYAVSDGVLYSAYIHPLSALSKKQIESAVFQVANLALSFGTDYTSGTLQFGGAKPTEEESIESDGISL